MRAVRACPQNLQCASARPKGRAQRKGKGKAKEAPNGAGDTPAQPEAVTQPEEGGEPRRGGTACPPDDENDGPAAVQVDDCLDGPEAYPDLVDDSETDDDEVDESVAAPASSAAPAAAGTRRSTAHARPEKTRVNASGGREIPQQHYYSCTYMYMY